MDISFFVKILLLISLSTYAIDDGRQIKPLPEDEKVYIESFEVALKVLEQCPPSDCVPVGIGRSPTSILAAISLLTRVSYQVPLSDFRNRPEGKRNGKALDGPISNYERIILYNHFDKYLPDAKSLGGKSIMAIDYSLTGSSLFAAQLHIQDYYKSKGASTFINGFMMLRRMDDKLGAVKEMGLEDYDISKFVPFNIGEYEELDRALLSSSFDDHAKFGQFNPLYNNEVKENEKYKLLESRLKDALRNNSELQLKIKNYLGSNMYDLLLGRGSGDDCSNHLRAIMI